MRHAARLLVAALLVSALGCAGGPAPVVVGGKNFTEQRILGEIVAQTLEAAGLPVARRLDLGGTFVCDAALRAGEIDVYVEYTGTALGAILHEEAPRDPAAARRRVAAAYADAALVWTAPLGFDNTFALVVPPAAGVHTISEAVAPARRWQAAVGYEFESRSDGLPALARVYGLEFARVRTMDLGLLYQALAERRVDLAVGSVTDGLIARFGFRVLADDRHAFPPYEAAPVVRRDALRRYPALAPALASLGGALDAETMRALNLRVDAAHESPAAVAAAWRRSRSGSS